MASKKVSPNKKELFRLAAVLYADDNYRVVPKTTIKKIVESVFINNNNSKLGLTELSNTIDEYYSIKITRDEIGEVIQEDDGSHFIEDIGENGGIYYSLSNGRLKLIENKIQKKGIDHFISRYHQDNELGISRKEFQELIYNYLYEILNASISGYEKILGGHTFDGKSITDDSVLTKEQASLISGFLNWDNKEKNKAVFDIASSALEYCMLTSDGKHKSLNKTNIQNKVFYLDTNVLFRAIGIDGKEEQKSAQYFLKKVNVSHSSLRISRYTEKEFLNSIEYYLELIKPYVKRIRSAEALEKDGAVIGVFKMFCQWRGRNGNASLNMFESYIKGQYNLLKEKYNLETDYRTEVNLTDSTIKDKVSDLESAISRIKGGIISNRVTHDAKLIFLIESKRDNHNMNLYDTKHFFISIDRGLRRWDFQRSEDIPIVLTPSQWLAIVLRYVTRTSNDYKSFVSFLGVNKGTPSLDNEKMLAALAGINTYVENLDEQKFLLAAFVDKRFKEGLNGKATAKEIEEKAAEFAKSKLENRVEMLEKEHHKLIKELDSEKKDKSFLQEDLNKVKKESKKAAKAVHELERIKIDKRVKKWRWPARYIAIPGSMLLAASIMLFFAGGNWEFNYIAHAINFIDLMQEGTKKVVMQGLLYSVLFGGIPFLGGIIYHFYFNKEAISKAEDRFKNQVS